MFIWFFVICCWILLFFAIIRLKIVKQNMVNLFPKSELEAQEKFVDFTESVQAVPKRFYVILAVVAIAALPLWIVLRFAFLSLLVSGYHPPEIIYQKPVAREIEVVEKKYFFSGADGIFAYARIRNPNANLGVRMLNYRFILKDAAGQVIADYQTSTSTASYLLPGQDQMLLMPLQKVTEPPASVELLVHPQRWSQVGGLENLDFIFEQQQFGIQPGGSFAVSALLRNNNPYIIPEVEVSLLLYDSSGAVTSVNYTTLNYVNPYESRFFRVVWPTPPVGKVARVEFKPSVNLLKNGALLTGRANPDEYLDANR